MYYKVDYDFDSFNFWSGAYDRISTASDKQRIEDCLFDDPDRIPTDTEINDFVWFECDDIFFENEEE